MTAEPVTATSAVEATGLVRAVGAGPHAATIVRDVDMSVSVGELVVIRGPSGSGKTTLLHLLSGFDQPTAGSVQWRGHRGGEWPLWATVAVVPQTLGLLPELSYLEHMHFVVGRDQHDKAIDALRLLDVDHLRTRLPGQTSLGQQQRLAVARALVGRPQMIAADEPTSHQGARHGELLLSALRGYVDNGGAAVVVSHDPAVAAGADRVLTMSDGRLT